MGFVNFGAIFALSGSILVITKGTEIAKLAAIKPPVIHPHLGIVARRKTSIGIRASKATSAEIKRFL